MYWPTTFSFDDPDTTQEACLPRLATLFITFQDAHRTRATAWSPLLQVPNNPFFAGEASSFVGFLLRHLGHRRWKV